MEVNVDAAKKELEAAGYVVLKAASYRRAQERQHLAQVLMESEKRYAEGARQWASDCLAEERRLRDRCTYLYGLAASRGCSDEELRGPT